MEAVYRRGNGSGNGIHLGGVAGTKYRQHPKERIGKGQPGPLFAKAVADIVHGTANQLAVAVALMEMHRQRHFCKLGAHAKESGTPHPENSTGSAQGNGPCYAGDIAGAHSAGQCGTYRLKRSHGAVGGILFLKHASQGSADRIGKLSDLQKTGADA